MRRQGGRVHGVDVLTKRGLREMLDDEREVRSLVHQLMVVGRDVRSTPMQWAYEGKKLDCAVKHLSWRPPWVRGHNDDSFSDDVFEKLCMSEYSDGVRREGCRIDDVVGLGRTPFSWFTLNCPYNMAFDIHRLNVSSDLRDKAVALSGGDLHKQACYNFIRPSRLRS